MFCILAAGAAAPDPPTHGAASDAVELAFFREHATGMSTAALRWDLGMMALVLFVVALTRAWGQGSSPCEPTRKRSATPGTSRRSGAAPRCSIGDYVPSFTIRSCCSRCDRNARSAGDHSSRPRRDFAHDGTSFYVAAWQLGFSRRAGTTHHTLRRALDRMAWSRISGVGHMGLKPCSLARIAKQPERLQRSRS